MAQLMIKQCHKFIATYATINIVRASTMQHHTAIYK